MTNEIVAAIGAVALAAFPGLLAFLWGRRFTEAPGFGVAERWTGNDLRLSIATSVAVVFACRFSPVMAVTVALPLVGLVSTLAGRFPSRRRVFQETWGFGAYLAQTLGTLGVVLGPWLALPFLPVLADGREGLVAASLCAIGLVVLHESMPALFRRALAARPLEDSGLATPFAQFLASSRLRGVDLLVGGRPGGQWPNVSAVPGRRSYVVIGRTLVDQLGLEESAALTAHSLAMLERQTTFSLRLRGAFVVLALGGVAAAVRFGENRHFGMLWTVVAAVALLWRMSLLGRNQMQGDRRAIELGADPEALIRALVRGCALSLVPRRLDGGADGGGLVPGLDRRIRAIRSHAGLVAPTIEGETVIASSEPGRYVVFGPRQLHLLEGVAEGIGNTFEALRSRALSARTVAYATLKEIGLASRPGGAVLRVSSSDGGRWKIPLADAELGRVQAVLNVVDGHVGNSGAQAGLPPRTRLSRWLAIMTVSIAWAMDLRLEVGAIALLAAIRPSGASMIALAVSVLARIPIVLLWGREGHAFGHTGGPGLALLGVMGLLALAMGARRSGPTRKDDVWLAVGVPLAALALIWTAIVFTASSVAEEIPHYLRYAPGLITLPAGAGLVFLLFSRRPVARASGFAFLGLAGVTLAAGTGRLFAPREGELRATAPALTLVQTSGPPEHVLELARPTDFRLWDGDRGGLRLAYRLMPSVDSDDPRWKPTPFVVSDPAGDMKREILAVDLQPSGPGRVVKVVSAGDKTRLEEIGLGEGNDAEPLWSVSVPKTVGRLLVDPASRRWLLMPHRFVQSKVGFSGVVGDPSFRTESAESRDTAGFQIESPYLVGPTSLSVGQRGGFRSYEDVSELLYYLYALAPPPMAGTDLFMTVGSERKRIGWARGQIWCHKPSGEDRRFLCSANTNEDWTLWSIDPRGEAPTALANTSAILPHTAEANGDHLMWENHAGLSVLNVRTLRQQSFAKSGRAGPFCPKALSAHHLAFIAHCDPDSPSSRVEIHRLP